MTEPETFMTIGDFAREAGLTPKALRLYGDLGLVRLAEVDVYSGYRHYAPAQLGRARTSHSCGCSGCRWHGSSMS